MVIDDMDVNTGETTSFMLCLKPFSMHFSLKCFRNLNLCLDVKLKLFWETFLVKVALLEGMPLVGVAWQEGRPIWEEWPYRRISLWWECTDDMARLIRRYAIGGSGLLGGRLLYSICMKLYNSWFNIVV